MARRHAIGLAWTAAVSSPSSTRPTECRPAPVDTEDLAPAVGVIVSVLLSLFIWPIVWAIWLLAW